LRDVLAELDDFRGVLGRLPNRNDADFLDLILLIRWKCLDELLVRVWGIASRGNVDAKIGPSARVVLHGGDNSIGVLLRRIEADERTPGGIIIPDTAKEKPVEGEVLAVGEGVVDEMGKLRPPGVKVGDRVLVSKRSGTEVLIGGEDRLILKESQILGIVVP
jgi:chaperonin GroES